jgi:hypothetical protein
MRQTVHENGATPLTSLKLSLQLCLRRLRALTDGTNGAAAAFGALERDAGLRRAVEQLRRTERQMDRLEGLVND